MKTIGKFFSIYSLAMLLFISCKSDDSGSIQGPDFSISDMAGSWVATQALFIPAAAHEPEDEMYIVQDGGSVTLVVQSNGRFTLTIDAVDRDAYTVTGKMFFEDGEFFAIEFDKYPGDYDYYAASLTSTTLVLNGGPTAGEYDFDDNGTFESASVFLTFARA